MLFEFTIKEKEGINIIQFKGNLLDKYQASKLFENIDEQLNEGNKFFILNLKALKYLNSSGLNILLNILTKTRNQGGETVLVELSPQLKELLIMTKLITVFKVFEKQTEAIEYIKKNNTVSC